MLFIGLVGMAGMAGVSFMVIKNRLMFLKDNL